MFRKRQGQEHLVRELRSVVTEEPGCFTSRRERMGAVMDRTVSLAHHATCIDLNMLIGPRYMTKVMSHSSDMQACHVSQLGYS